MAHVLKIKDLTNGRFLAFDLRHLLALIPSEGERLAWCAFPIGEGTEVTGDLQSVGTTAQAFEESADSSHTGLLLSWQDLRALAAAIHQTIWGTFIGCQNAATFERLASLFQDDWYYLDRAAPAFYAAVEIAFQAIDSSFWLVYAKEEAVRERIRNAFNDVEVIVTE